MKPMFSEKYYGSEVGEGPSVSNIVRDHLQKMTDVMNASVTSRTMVDVETADKVALIVLFYFSCYCAQQFSAVKSY